MTQISIRRLLDGSVAQPSLNLVSWKLKLGRAAIHKLLQNLQGGRLTLWEGEDCYQFGAVGGQNAIDAVVVVNDQRVYQRVLLAGSIGAGESYMQGDWTSPDLLRLIRLMVLNMDMVQRLDQNTSWFNKLASRILNLLTQNTVTGSRKNIAAHYDLSNEFFELMLDKQMMYSAAYFPDWDANLDYAAVSKLELVCQKLQLKPSDHLLEIGSGWGGMAIYAAKKYGCKVTTVTISQRQYEYAQAQINREGLQDKIELRLQDYRELKGQYDKLVSIEMIEAVGYRYYQQFFRRCNQLLKPDGLMLIQAITIADQRYESAKRSTDFIQKYIFPGGCLPSKAVIAKHVAQDTDMQLINLHDITAHYAQTLKLWRQRFLEQRAQVQALGFDDVFSRMWEFYLCYCEGGFSERVISTEQFLLAKPLARPEKLDKLLC